MQAGERAAGPEGQDWREGFGVLKRGRFRRVGLWGVSARSRHGRLELSPPRPMEKDTCAMIPEQLSPKPQPPRTPIHPQHQLGKKELVAVGGLGILFTVFWSLYFGQDLNWDLRNYQYYTVWAWLQGRITHNLAPAQVQTWLNPLVYLPHYLLIQHLPSMVAGTLFGVLSGVNFVLVYALTCCLLPGERPSRAIAVGLLCAAVGISAPQFLENLGTTSSDITVSIPVLSGLLLLCWSHHPGITSQARTLGYFLAGLLLGAACGLKLTCMIYAAGLTLSLLVLWPMLRFGARSFAAYAGGGLLGFVLTGGYWSWFLWREFANPVFPYYNAVFHSPWAVADNFRDARFLPQSFAGAIAYPFQWLVGNNPAGESLFRDPRFALLFVLLPIPLLALAAEGIARRRNGFKRRGGGQFLVAPEPYGLLLLFFISSYAIWITTFAIHRYLIPLTLLSGLILFLALDRLFRSNARKITLLAALSLFCVVWTRVDITERLPYAKDWFGFELVPAVSEPNTLFVMMSDAPESYVVPFLPESDRFIRISGNFPLQAEIGLGRRAVEAITQHRGPIRSLSAGALAPSDRLHLARFGLDLSETGCVTFRSRMDQFRSCPLSSGTTPSMAGLTVDPRSRIVQWNSPAGSSARVYVRRDSSPKQFFAEGFQGSEQATWILPGHRYVFEMVGWDGTKEGPWLATVRIDEHGNVSGQTFQREEIPAITPGHGRDP